MFRRCIQLAKPAAGAVRKNVLFTPGPLMTTPAVKEAMLVDYGSRDSFFMETVRVVRDGVVDIAGLPPAQKGDWSCVPMQGSGTMGVEAAISTSAPRTNAKAAVVSNGAYGVRHTAICRRLGIDTEVFEWPEGAAIDLAKFTAFIRGVKGLTTFVVVHSETSTGALNPIEEMSDIVRAAHPGATIIVDAMSSFGGVPIATDKACDVLVSSSNKCIQGVPGFSIALARKAQLAEWRGRSRSYTLDLAMQFDSLEKNGQFAFTPPTHVLVAFRQALAELEAEGGVAARHKRYSRNADLVIDGMLALGFELFVADRKAKHLGPIIVSFNYPKAPSAWEFKWFYEALKARECVIYPGKASKADTFRIGCIGDLHDADYAMLLKAVEEVLAVRNIKLK